MPTTAKPLLIVDDDLGLLRQLRWAFSDHRVYAAGARQEAIDLVRREAIPVAIVDLGLPPDPDGASEGLATLSEILTIAPATKVIIATGNETREHALRAVALGAYDFYQKPIDIDVLRLIVSRAGQMFELEAENRRLMDAAAISPVDGIIAGSPEMLQVLRSIEKIAPTDVAVLLLGESGTGKELLAQAIHKMSARASAPFVPINCAAIPETLLESELFGHEKGAFTGALRQNIGRIESADRGTLFLDEIGDVPLTMQVKLLRFLQDQVVERVGGRKPVQVDVRIVCATNQDLDRLMAEGRFREDLFYRLNEVTVRVPPLRERLGDAILLGSFHAYPVDAQAYQMWLHLRLSGTRERPEATTLVHVSIRSRTSSRSRTTRMHNAKMSSVGSSKSGTITVIMPAAAADRTPMCESSRARHNRGSTPSRSAAFRNGSGAGLPFS